MFEKKNNVNEIASIQISMAESQLTDLQKLSHITKISFKFQQLIRETSLLSFNLHLTISNLFTNNSSIFIWISLFSPHRNEKLTPVAIIVFPWNFTFINFHSSLHFILQKFKQILQYISCCNYIFASNSFCCSTIWIETKPQQISKETNWAANSNK